MGLFKKKETEFISPKHTQEKPNGEIITTQLIKGKVIEVGNEEDENSFSYKYSFINPITNNMEEATDYLKDILVGEQIFDIGDDVFLVFSDEPDEIHGTNYVVTRQMVFPKIVNKKKRISKFFKIMHILLLIVLTFICSVFTILSQYIQQ